MTGTNRPLSFSLPSFLHQPPPRCFQLCREICIVNFEIVSGAVKSYSVFLTGQLILKVQENVLKESCNLHITSQFTIKYLNLLF